MQIMVKEWLPRWLPQMSSETKYLAIQKKKVTDTTTSLQVNRVPSRNFCLGGNWGSLLNSQFLTHLWYWLYYGVVMGP